MPSIAKELRDLDMDELQLRAAELQKEMFDIRQRLVTKEETNTAKLSGLKRHYARLLTVIREKNNA
jgi:ribosomal protein L29